jgi:hypothetical protein
MGIMMIMIMLAIIMMIWINDGDNTNCDDEFYHNDDIVDGTYSKYIYITTV